MLLEMESASDKTARTISSQDSVARQSWRGSPCARWVPGAETRRQSTSSNHRLVIFEKCAINCDLSFTRTDTGWTMRRKELGRGVASTQGGCQSCELSAGHSSKLWRTHLENSTTALVSGPSVISQRRLPAAAPSLTDEKILSQRVFHSFETLRVCSAVSTGSASRHCT